MPQFSEPKFTSDRVIGNIGAPLNFQQGVHPFVGDEVGGDEIEEEVQEGTAATPNPVVSPSFVCGFSYNIQCLPRLINTSQASGNDDGEIAEVPVGIAGPSIVNENTSAVTGPA